MWSFQAEAETTGSPDAVWQAWQDVTHWNSWNPMIRESSLNGPFTTGTHGTVTPAKGPRGSFVLTEVQDGRRWASRAKMPLANLDFIYELIPAASGTRIVMRAEISGLLSPLAGMMVGGPCKVGLPEAVKNLKALAEKAPAAL